MNYFECSIRVCFTCIILYTLYFKLPKMFYPSQLLLTVCLLFCYSNWTCCSIYCTYIVYFHMHFQHQKTTFNKCTYELACQYSQL